MVRFRILVVALAVAAASLVVTAASASALAKPKGVQLHGSPGPKAISVQWKWAKKPTRYRVQLAKKKNFTGKVRTRVVKAAKKRPRHGRQAVTFAKLARATHYHYRIRAEKGHKHSKWSRVRSAWTIVPWPAQMSHLTIVPGPKVGQATFRWRSSGKSTKTFTISTALTQFGLNDKSMPSSYHKFTFSAKSARAKKHGHFRKTLTAKQLRAAHASVSSAHFLFAHLEATNANRSHTKPYLGIQALVPLGRAASGAGDPITVANYNILGYNASAKSGKSQDEWKNRIDKVVANIVAADPDVVTMQENGATEINDNGDTQAKQLLRALNKASSRTYAYNREGSYVAEPSTEGHTQAVRLIYDTGKFTQVSGDECKEIVASAGSSKSSCAFSADHRWVSYVHLQAVNSPQVRFWVAAAHLDTGRNKAAEKTRKAEIRTIMKKLDSLRGSEPVILGMDSNTWQTYKVKYGIDSLSHNALIGGGYYDTAASANVAAHTTSNYGLSNPTGPVSDYRYSTSNGKLAYGKGPQPPSTNGYAARLDVIAVKGMPGADDFGYDHAKSAWPGSDHNLVWAKLRLPAPS